MDADVIDEFRTILEEMLADSDGELTWETLSEIGWPDLLSEDPIAAIGVLIPGQARNLVVTPALEAIALSQWGIESGPDEVGVLFSALPARAAGAARVGEVVTVSAVVARGPLAGIPSRFAAVADSADGEVVAIIEGISDAVEAAPPSSLAPETGWRRVEATGTIAEIVAAGAAAAETVSRGRRLVGFAIATELAAVADVALEMASDHAKSRVQFDRPLGAFQAVKHRLAQSAVETAATATSLRIAEESFGTEGDDLPVLVARIQAGVAATESLSHATQLFGGMGYSWELPLHRYVRRAFLLDTLDGPLSSLERTLGERVLERHPLPRLAVFG
jgi:hypothetical protein